MSQPILIPGTQIALINPATGRFDDTLAPPSVAANAASAYSSAVAAQASADAAAASSASAGGGSGAAAAAAAAAASAAAAVTASNNASAQATAAAASAAAAAAAVASGGGGASQSTIDASIAAEVSLAGRTGDYTQLSNKPDIAGIQTSLTDKVSNAQLASGLSAQVHRAELGAANGVPQLDGNAQLLAANQSPGVRLYVGDGGPTIPIRPAYAGTVVFDCTTPPPFTGTIAGGTAAAVPSTDRWES